MSPEAFETIRQEILEGVDSSLEESRNTVRRRLVAYAELFGMRNEDHDILRLFLEFIDDGRFGLSRHEFPGHFTASLLVVNQDYSKVLLTHHRKLGKWLQLGGHVDGNPRLEESALREANEESGLRRLDWEFAEGDLILPFDLDRHLIPANDREPEHFHYDVRYLARSDDGLPLQISEESNDLAWHTLNDARKLNPERSMSRMFEKVERLRDQIA